MTCPKCKKEIPEGSDFCPECGASVAPAPTPAPAPAPAENANPSGGIFVDADEKVVATLRNGILLNILSGEGLKGEDAILTNKRLYYNHRSGLISYVRVEEKIDVADITGTKISDSNPLGLLIFAILLAVIAFVIGGIGIAQAQTAALAPAFGIFLVALFFLIIYLIALKKHLRIEYAGGFIQFSVKGYKMENVRAFQKSIHALKEQLRK